MAFNYYGGAIKPSVIAQQYRNLQSMKDNLNRANGPYQRGLAENAIRYQQNKLSDAIENTASSMGRDRFDREMKFGLEHGFRSGH